MLSLFDLMKQAQNGMAMDTYAKQFGLAREQAMQAMTALMPAFSTGLKRNASNPYDMANLMMSMSSGNYGKYLEDIRNAFTPQGIMDGNSAMSKIFGSPDAANAIAAQASQMTGLGQDVLKAMMPAMADTIMGGLVKQTTEQFEAAARSFGVANPMSDMMTQWMQAVGLQEKPKTNPMFDNPFTQSMQAMFGGQPQPPASMANAFADNPFAKAMTDMMAAMTQGATAASAPAEAPKAEKSADVSDYFSAMFDSGLEVQKSYQKSLESILDTYWKAGEAPKA